MRWLALIPLLLTASCHTSAGIRSMQPIAEAVSAKAPDVVAGCIALNLGKYRDTPVRTEAIPNGMSVIQSVPVSAFRSPMTTIDVVGAGSGSTVTVRAVGARGRRMPLSSDITACL